MHAAANRGVLMGRHPTCSQGILPSSQSREPPWLRRASADHNSAGAAFNDIAPSIQYVQLTSATAQQAQQMSDALPDQGCKAPFRRTRLHAYGILRSADSSAF